MRRMDRYAGEEVDTTDKVSRSNKNQDLYRNIGRNARYANYSDVANANAYDISNIDKNNKTRENYQKMKEYSNLIPGPKVKRELEEFKNINKVKENRVHDINSVIAEARKNRKEIDDKESHRKLKDDKYNILLSMSKEELEEYRKMRKEKYTHPDEEQLDEIIDDIATKLDDGKLDKDTTVNLLSELMATSIMDKVEPNQSNQETDNKEKEETDEKEELELDDMDEVEENVSSTSNDEEEYEEEINEEIIEQDSQDKSFLTDEKLDPNKLNELKEELDKKEKQNIGLDGADSEFYSEKDLKGMSFDGEMDEEFKEKGIPVIVKIMLILIIFAVFAVAGYFIWQMI